MKYLTYAAGVAALAGQAVAFPAAMFEALAKLPRDQLEKSLEGRQVIAPGFNATLQYVSTTGAHKFVAPGKGDLRGPCPGLNALANHNYLPHNGVATITQFIEATNVVYGMGLDLSTFLAIYGAVFDGDLLSWSIGGPPAASLVSPLAGLIGQPQGLSGSHNKYENDASPGRGDLYQYGNDYKLVLSQFKGLYNLQGSQTEATSNYNIEVLTDWRATRFQQSISQNPYFFNGIFSGLLVQPAAYTFAYRFMANHTADYPEGRLSQNVLKTFFSITGSTPDKFVYTEGYERIPDNWYRRAFGDEYTIPFFLTDVIAMAIIHPEFLSVGGNLGKNNTFFGLDLGNLTGGVYTASNLLQGNNLFCFALQATFMEAPDILSNIFLKPSIAEGILQAATLNATNGLGCPKLNNIDQSQFNQFPGYSKLSSKGTY